MAFLGVLKPREGNKPNEPDFAVSETLIESGWFDESKAIMRSVEVAKGKYIEKNALNSLKEKTQNVVLGMALTGTIGYDKIKNYIGFTKGSARDFFKGLFVSEHQEASSIGMETETIGSEAGIWGLEVPLANKPSVDETISKIEKGIEAYVKKNDMNLNKIYEQNKASKRLTFKYEDRLEPQNIKTWLRVVGQYREQDSQESVKEISSQIKNGIVQKRDKPLVTDAFQIIKCNGRSQIDQARNLSQMAQDQPVVKIILVTKFDKNGKEYVDSIETWQPHFTMNGSQGVDFLSHITEEQGLITEERDIKRSQILRKKVLPNKEGNMPPIFDISIDYNTGGAENTLKKMAVKSTEPRMKETVLQMSAWLSLTRDKSGYICVDPLDDALSNVKNKTDLKRQSAPAELQLAFITAGPELDDIYDRANGRLKRRTKNELEYIELLRDILGIGRDSTIKSGLVVSRALAAMKETNELSQDEFLRSSQGRGTIATLSAHLPELARAFFKFIYSREDKLVSQGSIQLSKVKARKLKGVRFRSALNLHTDASAAEIQTETTIHNNFRVRTDPQKYIEIREKLLKGANPDIKVRDTEVEELLVLDAKRQIAEQRKMQVILSLLLLKNNPNLQEDDLAIAIKLGHKAFEEIDNDMNLN